MALIKCSECGKEISDKAVACINCGCPVSVATAKTPAPETSYQNAASPATGTPGSLSVKYDAVLSGAENEKSMQSVFVKDLFYIYIRRTLRIHKSFAPNRPNYSRLRGVIITREFSLIY